MKAANLFVHLIEQFLCICSLSIQLLCSGYECLQFSLQRHHLSSAGLYISFTLHFLLLQSHVVPTPDHTHRQLTIGDVIESTQSQLFHAPGQYPNSENCPFTWTFILHFYTTDSITP